MLNLILDFSRNQEPENPFFRPDGKTVGYTLHSDGGAAYGVNIEWSKELLADLAHVGKADIEPAIVQRMGNRLRALLPPRYWAVKERLIEDALNAGEPIRITIRSTAEELYTLPWDLLTQGSGQHLCARPNVLLRYALPGTRTVTEKPAPRPEGGRVLFAWSEVGGTEIPLDAQRDTLEAACKQAHVPFTELPKVSVAKLKQALANDPKVAVLHILCHGQQQYENSETIGLALYPDVASPGAAQETDHKSAHVIDARQLEALLSPYAGHLRLVVLSACQSADIYVLGNHLGSPTLAIHKAGIQTVVASRFVLSQDASEKYFETFYRELLGQPTSVEEAFLAARRSVLHMEEKLAWASLQLYARPEDGEDTRPVVFRPYRGLLPFDASHGRFLVGRDAEINEIIADMAALQQAGQPRFQSVLGATGTGTSSIVLGGVASRLIRDEKADAAPDPSIKPLAKSVEQLQQYMKLRGGDRMLQQMVQMLESKLAGLRGTTGAKWQAEMLRINDAPIAALDAALARRSEDREFLLVVDQLEDLFTQTADAAIRQEFVRKLWQSAQGEKPIHCIITLRPDFLDQCAEIVIDEEKNLRLDQIASDETHRVFVGPMKRAELGKSIDEPARRVGLELEPGLSVQMLNEVGDEPGALPLLQHMLDLLWQRRDGRRLTLTSYYAQGGVIGSIARQADAVFASLGPDEQTLARRVFVQLVGLGHGGSTDTRKRLPRAALRAREAGNEQLFDKVTGKLETERLIVCSSESGTAMLEVAHEALVRRWQRLQDWLSEDRAKLIELHELEALVEKCRDGLHGSQIGYARAVLDKYPELVKPETRKIIEDSERIAQELLDAERQRAEHDRQRLYSSFVEEGRNHLLDGDPARALLWLDRAYREGVNTTSMRYLLAEAMRPYDALRLSLSGHERAIYHVEFSPDGSRIVTCSADKTARIWDAQSGQCLSILTGHQGAVNGASFSADGKRLLTTSDDRVPLVWDVATGNQLHQLDVDGGLDPISSLSANGQQAILVGNGYAEIWNLAAQQRVFQTPAHSGLFSVAELSRDGSRLLTTISSAESGASLWDVASSRALPLAHTGNVLFSGFSSDGKRAVTVGGDTAIVWDAQNAAALQKIRHGVEVYRAVFTPDASRLITIAGDNIIRIWDTASAKLLLSLSGHRGPISKLRVSRDGSRILSVSRDDTVKIWNATTGDQLSSLLGYAFMVSDASLSPDGSRAVTATADTTARIWDVRSSKLQTVLNAQHSQVKSVGFDVSGGRLFFASGADIADFINRSADRVTTGSATPGAQVWDARTGRQLAALCGGAGITAAAFSSDGNRVFTSGCAAAELWDAGTGKLLATLQGHESLVTGARFTPDGTALVTLSDQFAIVWQASDGTQRHTLEADENVGFSCLIPSSDSKQVAVGAIRGSVHIWDLETGERTHHFRHDAAVLAVCFSADGKHLFAGYEDGTVRRWDLDGSQVSAILHHRHLVRSLSLSPDGKRLLSTSNDQSAKIWDAQTGKLIVSLEGHTGPVRAGIFSPNGRCIVTASIDKTVRIWDAELGKPLSTLTHGGIVDALAFSPDGNRLMTGSWDKTVRIWELRFESREKEKIQALIAQHIPLHFEGDTILPNERAVEESC